MRLFAAPTSNAPFYDRNPLTVVKSYSANGQAPAAFTTRWTYTVPANRKAQMVFQQVVTGRVTAGAPAGATEAETQITPSGGSQTQMMRQLWTDNTLMVFRNQSTGSSMVLLAGDAVFGANADLSTGGTINYEINAQFTEFDA